MSSFVAWAQRLRGAAAAQFQRQVADQVIDRPPLTSDERRRHERRALRVSARIHLSGGQVFEIRTFDISLGGLAIVASAAPRPGTVFRVVVGLPLKNRGEVTIDAEAQVLHSFYSNTEGAYIVGLRFAALDPVAANAIAYFVG